MNYKILILTLSIFFIGCETENKNQLTIKQESNKSLLKSFKENLEINNDNTSLKEVNKSNISLNTFIASIENSTNDNLNSSKTNISSNKEANKSKENTNKKVKDQSTEKNSTKLSKDSYEKNPQNQENSSNSNKPTQNSKETNSSKSKAPNQITSTKGTIEDKKETITPPKEINLPKIDSNSTKENNNSLKDLNNSLSEENITIDSNLTVDTNSTLIDINITDNNSSNEINTTIEEINNTIPIKENNITTDTHSNDINDSLEHNLTKESISSLEKNITNLNKLIIDNDSYDPDYIPLVLASIHEHRWKLVNIELMIISEQGLSNKTNMLYRSILNEFNSTIPLTLAHNTSDRAFISKLTNNLENYTPITYDNEVEDAIFTLQTTLEASEDKSISYATGGKLIFLSKFLSDPYRLELFKLKVKEVLFALGCNPLDYTCSRDFNLAATPKAYEATKDVYSKLHNKIPFVLVVDNRNSVRSLDIFKSANIPLMNHLLGTNIYGTYGDHNAGDIEILLAKSREKDLEKYTCNVSLINQTFKAQSIGIKGNDILLINKKYDINWLTKEMYKSLIKTYKEANEEQ